MGIYGSFKYGHIFPKSLLSPNELNTLFELKNRFSVCDYGDIIVISDKTISIENSGLGIEMLEFEKGTLVVNEYIASHENDSNIFVREFKMKKYRYKENDYCYKCDNKKCGFCFGFSYVDTDENRDENEENSVTKKRKHEFDIDKLDFLSQDIIQKITHSGWFNVVFCSVDMSTDVYIPLKYNLKEQK